MPKISIVTRKAMGGAYVAMGSKQMRNDITFAWPTAQIAVMGPQGAVNLHPHGLGFLLQQGLRGQHVFHFGRADAMRQRAKGAVRGRVRVAADDRHAGQGRTLLRADHMHDTLALVVHVEVGQAVMLGVLVQRFHLQARDRIGNAVDAAGGGHVMVGHGQVGGNAPRLAARHAETIEGLRAGDFVQQVPVDIQNCRAIIFGPNNVGFPEFVVKRLHHDLCSVATACLSDLSY